MEADGRPTPNPDDDWGAELFEAGGPEEPTAVERGLDVEYASAEDVFSPQTQEALTLLSFAVWKLGGAMVIPKEELATRFRLALDNKFYRETGGVRVYVVVDDNKEDA